jgi:hypothetical protein
VNNKGTRHYSIRIPLRLSQMIERLLPLFDEDFTAVVLHILKNYEFSENHKDQLDKLERMRFETMFRDAELKIKLKELSTEEMKIMVEEIKKGR